MPGASVSPTTTKAPGPMTRWSSWAGGVIAAGVSSPRLPNAWLPGIGSSGWTGAGTGDSSRPGADFGHDELAGDAMAVIQATGVRRVVPVTQAHGGWPALRLRRLLGDRVTGIVLLSWMVVDPPPPFLAVFEMLQDPGRGGRVWTTCSPGGWPAPRKTWPDGPAGRLAATALTCGHEQRAR